MEEEKWESALMIKKYALDSSLGSSPMTNLAHNLEESARLRDTPKRRISWSNDSVTASPPELVSLKNDDQSSEFPPSPCSTVFTLTLTEGSLNKNDPNDRIQFRSTPIQKTRSMPMNSSKLINKENVICCDSVDSLSFIENALRSKEEHNGNSRDSGYSDRQEKFSTDFIFTEPNGMPPRRTRTPSQESQQLQAHSIKLTIDNSENKTEDDGFLDGIESNTSSEASDAPSGFNQLIKGKIAMPNSTNPPETNMDCSVSRSPFNDLCNINVDTPKAKSCIRGLFGATKLNFENLSNKKSQLKRQEISRDSPSPVQMKRRRNGNCYQRSESATLVDDSRILPKRSPLHRAFSDTHADIMKAVQKSVQEPNLIGDCSKPYVLPLIEGRHQDLKMVSHNTIKDLLTGEYDTEIEKYIIVDCRYPYEYEGGHIKGAINTYTKEGIINQFLYNPIRIDENSKRLIVVFHCEFSSERAPNLSRFLRNRDRVANKECYPQLHYPEVYVIEGGYKMFFEHHRSLCEPENYLPMLHKDHELDLRHFRAKSKSWNGEKGNLRFGSRPSGLNI